MALTSTITARVEATQTNALDLGTASLPLSVSAVVRLVSGTSSGQADLLWSDTRTLAASGTEDLDLAGVLASAFGATLTYARVKAIMVKASTGNTNNVNVTRPASNGVPLFLAASDGIAVPPGGVFLWATPGTGAAVTAGTGDLVTFTNSAGTTPVTYDVVIIGASA